MTWDVRINGRIMGSVVAMTEPEALLIAQERFAPPTWWDRITVERRRTQPDERTASPHGA